jgi:hypothetical protein
MKNATILLWDFEMDMDELNKALAKCARPVVFKVNTRGG